MKAIQPETIVRLGCEGGGADLLGARDDAGVWRFWMKGNSIALDDDEEDWRFWETQPVATWAEALALLPDDWLCFVPLEFHPEFKELLRAAIYSTLPTMPEDWLRRFAKHGLPRWRELGILVEIPKTD